ncbi:hypothetical protein A1O7_07087 [Cladophialophora yegresii CBS 114405]|uniref:Uncharacterized protein n=1 Tax=Cladophialophora yegresii CBS 114405 TaxID=1182544 RepID=W9VMI4_9EURO|nr:uncharacterized protein A1O7_07087 [Cladophialophora yegresii CBS 114405]EXJ56743.1 hypothetical protein A1O7_07087 [Cladophialophora yegresii CBS 114405]
MSCEQRYDYSYYEEFVENDLPDLNLFSLPELELFELPSPELSDNSTLAAMTELSSSGMPGNCLGLSQGIGMSFSNGPDTSEQCHPSLMEGDAARGLELDSLGTMQPEASNVFTIRDQATTVKLGAENSHCLGDDVQPFDNSAGSSTAQLPFETMDSDAPSHPVVLNNASAQGACRYNRGVKS